MIDTQISKLPTPYYLSSFISHLFTGGFFPIFWTAFLYVVFFKLKHIFSRFISIIDYNWWWLIWFNIRLSCPWGIPPWVAIRFCFLIPLFATSFLLVSWRIIGVGSTYLNFAQRLIFLLEIIGIMSSINAIFLCLFLIIQTITASNLLCWSLTFSYTFGVFIEGHLVLF